MVGGSDATEDQTESHAKSKGNVQETVIIDPKGDLLLVAGPDKMAIRVSSHCFRMASKVFDAMLQPNFQEGVAFANRNQTQPFQLLLPDDDGQAFTLLARLLHFQGPAIDYEQKKDVRRLVKLLALCDKYDCMRAVYYYASTWASLFEKLDPSQLVAAYLLDNPGLFAHISRDIILSLPPLNAIQTTADPEALLPIGHWIELEKRQRSLRKMINDVIILSVPYSNDDPSDPFGLANIRLSTGKEQHTITMRHCPKASKGCETCSLLRPWKILGFQNCLARENLWPPPDDLSINSIIDKIRAAAREDNIQKQYNNGFPSSKEPCQCKEDLSTDLLLRFIEVKRAEKGLCLDCMSTEKKHNNCRRGH